MEGIRLLAPKIIVVENVAAIRHRGLDQVLGDLAESGYDAVWTSIRASNVGAPHRRERTFILAYQPSARAILTAADAAGQRRARRTAAGCAASRRPPGRPERSRPRTVPGSAPAPDSAGLCRDETARERSRRSPASVTSGWGVYESAVRRWERIIGRTAPYPVETGTKGQPRLSPALSEWLMGLPAGFVTDLGLPYSAQHRLLGNGVVPQQASAALRQLVRSAAREVPSA